MKNEAPTIDKIEAEPAGRRLDFWVAEFVLGWKRDDIGRWTMPGQTLGIHSDEEPVPHYSLTEAIALLQSDKLKSLPYVLQRDENERYQCILDDHCMATAPTMCLAICRCLLKMKLFPVCEACDNKGYVVGVRDVLGMPGGWVQRCDFCCKFFSDYDAFQSVLEDHGLPGMSGYPFSIVDRSDASPNNPLEQTFFVEALTTDGGACSSAVTLRNEGNGLFDIDQFEEAITQGFFSVKPQNKFIKGSVVIYDCLPVVEGAPGPRAIWSRLQDT